MTHAIHFLSTTLKDVPTSLCNYQLAVIEAVPAIFSNWRTVESSPTVPPTAVPNPPKLILSLPKPSPLRYPASTSKGGHVKYRVTTSRVVFKQQTPGITKGRQVEVNSKGGQELIAARTISRVASYPNLPPFNAQIQPIYEPVEARIRPRTVSHNLTTPSLSQALKAQILTHAASGRVQCWMLYW